MLNSVKELKKEPGQENLVRNSTDHVSYDSDLDVELSPSKRQKLESVLPVGFLDPLTPEERLALQKPIYITHERCSVTGNANTLVRREQEVSGNTIAKANKKAITSCKQFWKAGDYEVSDSGRTHTVGMDHVRVHPKFLHSNATSHKWALGAFAELLDNALDEVCYGATYVNIDVLENKKDGSKMLLIEDNGGGMTPDKMRGCMSLGYSVKSKMANTIGQYGNGFKTSTMRLGADVIVFSRSEGKNGESTTQSIGMLSYTFLRDTGKEDIVVPMIHFEKVGGSWNKQMIPSYEYLQTNIESIVQWSPYESEDDLLQQFNRMEDHGTRIIIYNLWEDDQGTPELDFETDKHDIQIKGFGPDERKIDDAKKYPNSKHFLTYTHSLRSYAAILYRKLPPGYSMTLRGKVIEHHDIVEDLMMAESLTYKPSVVNHTLKDSDMVAHGTIGFVKDARHHIDVQGFNVYHKNRLIKPFWRVWNAAGSDGRGVIGVLEANFVEPAHDKQGFERTAVLSRLEAKLLHTQKQFWTTKCHHIGYSQRRGSKKSVAPERAAPPTTNHKSIPVIISEKGASATPNLFKEASATANLFKEASASANHETNPKSHISNRSTPTNGNITPLKRPITVENRQPAVAASAEARTGQYQAQVRNHVRSSPPVENPIPHSDLHKPLAAAPLDIKIGEINGSGSPSVGSMTDMVVKLHDENAYLRKSLKAVKEELEDQKDTNLSLNNQIIDMKKQIKKLDEDQEAFVRAFTDERSRRELQEENMRQEIKDKSATIENLLKKVGMLEQKRYY